SSYFKFYYYHQRGCGKSTYPIINFESSNFYKNMLLLNKKLGLVCQIADIERIRQILGEEKIILMGHSFGAFLATLYAIEFPERVQAMILIAPANLLVMPPDEPDLFTTVQNLLPDSLRTEYAHFMKNYLNFQDIFTKAEDELAAINREFKKYYAIAANLKNPGTIINRNAQDNGGWMVFALYFSMGKSHDYREYVKKLGIPTLVIHGDKDLQTENASRMYADLLPNSKFEIIPHAGHFPFYEQPDTFAKVTGQFLKEIF
ncbi:alpha/beta hydrolase, partial [candidate division KSB1 bacterium]|nr:alpha/beta hydrolase [candidate division KSB1 bacterium]